MQVLPIYSKLIVNSLEHSEIKHLSDKNVSECMSKDVVSFSTKATIEDVISKTQNLSYNFFPIVDDENCLIGIISKKDIDDAIFEKINKQQEISLIMDTSPVIINENENICIAHYRLHTNNAYILIVIDSRKKVVGVVTRKDINKIV